MMIPLEVVARAYELRHVTDLSYEEISRALQVDQRRLVDNVRSFEVRGVRGVPKSPTPKTMPRGMSIVLNALKCGHCNAASVAVFTGYTDSHTYLLLRKAVSRGLAKRSIKRGVYYYEINS